MFNMFNLFFFMEHVKHWHPDWGVGLLYRHFLWTPETICLLLQIQWVFPLAKLMVLMDIIRACVPESQPSPELYEKEHGQHVER